MKTLFELRRLSLIAALGLFTFSCSDDDNDSDGSDNSILVEAQNQTSLSTFVEALERAGLDGTFNGTTNMTVFAPTNSAFSQYMTVNGYPNVNAIPVETLRELMLNHTMSGDIESSEISTGYKKTLAKGMASDTNFLDMYLDTSNGLEINGTATVTTPDIDANNGKIHIVDNVIALPTVMTQIRANDDLNTLESALGFNASSGFDATLSGTTDAPFTVFAPTNSAFSSYLTETGNTVFGDFDEAEFETTLEYHVASNNNALSSLFTNNQVFSTSAGQNFTINLTGGGKKITDANSRVSTMTKTDIQTSNGVIHLVDKVLMPAF